jgi:pimeloyl-ACP methyl ester carboxylesterase
MIPSLPELRTVDADGPIAYRQWDGPSEATFVLIHGLGGSHVNWVRVAPGLAGLGRVLALDLPGFGWSPLAGRSAALMDERRALAGFLDAMNIEEAVIAGNSMGGAVALVHAAVQPERVRGLVLTSSVFPRAKGAYPHPVVMGAFALYDTSAMGEVFVRQRMRRLAPEQAVRIGLRMTTAEPGAIPDDVVLLQAEAVRRRALDPEASTAFIDAARSLVRLGRRPDVARRATDAVRCPVLVLHGRRDRLVPARFAEVALERYPAWRARILSGVGHVPQLEAPGRWLAEVADWYAEHVD